MNTTGNERLDRKIQEMAQGHVHHILYKDGDTDAPESIRDQNGQIALSMCRVCGQGEVDLEEFCTVPGQVDRIITIKANSFAKSSIFKDNIGNDGKIRFVVKETVDLIKLTIPGKAKNTTVFVEAGATREDGFTEAKIIIGEIIQAYSDEG